MSVANRTQDGFELDYSVEDDGAVDAVDYTAVSGTLTFARSSLSATISVATLEDVIDEDEESIRLTLQIEDETISAAGTIIDDDDEPALGIADAEAAEADGSVVLSVDMSGNPTERTVTVGYSTDDGTAKAGDDYDAVAGTLTIQAGARQGTIEVPITADNHNEPERETFRVLLEDVDKATIGEREAIATIIDSDATPTVSVADAEGMEGDTLAFEVVMSPTSEFDHYVDYATEDGSAVQGDDYAQSSGRLSFAPRTARRTITVEAFEDDLAEPTEDFTVELTLPGGVSVGDADYLEIDRGLATGMIVSGAGELPELSIEDASAAEDAGEIVFQVTASTPSAMPVTVSYSTTDDTALGRARTTSGRPVR